MNIVCLDMEGVLVPEIWIAFAEESGIPELRRTTRDEPDYDKLMRWRIDLLRQRGLFPRGAVVPCRSRELCAGPGAEGIPEKRDLLWQ